MSVETNFAGKTFDSFLRVALRILQRFKYIYVPFKVSLFKFPCDLCLSYMTQVDSEPSQTYKM